MSPLPRLRLPAALAAGVLLLASARSGAEVPFDSYWYCSTDETLKVSGLPKSTDSYDGITLEFDTEGNVQIYLPDPDDYYQGTVVAKGKTGFVVAPSESAVLDLKDYVADRVQSLAGADSVTITSFSFTVKGKVVDGELRAVLKAKGKGSISLGDRTRKGAGKLTEKIVSLPPG